VLVNYRPGYVEPSIAGVSDHPTSVICLLCPAKFSINFFIKIKQSGNLNLSCVSLTAVVLFSSRLILTSTVIGFHYKFYTISNNDNNSTVIIINT
jgi:hypothetical protein